MRAQSFSGEELLIRSFLEATHPLSSRYWVAFTGNILVNLTLKALASTPRPHFIDTCRYYLASILILPFSQAWLAKGELQRERRVKNVTTKILSSTWCCMQYHQSPQVVILETIVYYHHNRSKILSSFHLVQQQKWLETAKWVYNELHPQKCPVWHLGVHIRGETCFFGSFIWSNVAFSPSLCICGWGFCFCQ